MEKQPSYVLKFTLEEISLRRVVVNLWNESDILSQIAKLGFKRYIYAGSRIAFRETVVDKVKAKVSGLVLPEAIKKQMMYIVKPIGAEIQHWKRCHEKYLSDSTEEFDVPVLEKLCWTTSGTVEYRKTAEQLVRCKMLDGLNRYKLACLYCLEDYIPGCWEELSDEIKSTYYNRDDVSHIRRPSLQYFWPYILKGEESQLNNIPGRITGPNGIAFNQYAFENSARSGNKAAAEYFFNRLTDLDREDSLFRIADAVVVVKNIELFENPDNCPTEKHPDVLCYLLSLMTPEQQMEVLKKRPCLFLRCFLDWPWQDLFLEIAAFIWTFLPVREYESLLFNMGKAVVRSGYYFPELFQEFFMRCPDDFKKCFVHQSCHFGVFFSMFIENQDSETIRVIFRNIDDDDRMKLVSSYWFFNVVDNLIMRDRWHFLELCLRDATLSTEDRVKLKKAFTGFLTAVGDKPLIKQREWRRFFRLLNTSDFIKRSSIDETLTTAKRLCCEH